MTHETLAENLKRRSAEEMRNMEGTLGEKFETDPWVLGFRSALNKISTAIDEYEAAERQA